MAYRSERQKANLRRGGIKGTPATAARAREGKARKQAAGRGRRDRWAYLQDLHPALGANLTAMVEAETKAGGTPSRAVTDRMREYRALTAELNDFEERRSSEEQAAAFLPDLAKRVSNMGRKLGVDLQDFARPIFEPGTGEGEPEPEEEPTPPADQDAPSEPTSPEPEPDQEPEEDYRALVAQERERMQAEWAEADREEPDP